MKALGRLLQLVGLAVLPLAMFMELTDFLGRIFVNQMVIMLVFGVAAFYLGRILEGYASN